MPVVVRLARRGDAERLARINIDAWRAAYDGIVSSTRLAAMDFDAYCDRWQREISVPTTVTFVAQIDEVVAAYCVGGAAITSDPDDSITATTAELCRIYADPAMQGQGAGSGVHDELLRYLHGQGYAEAVLWVFEANTHARAWYAARGWRPDGADHLFDATGTPVPEIRLRRSLTTRDGN